MSKSPRQRPGASLCAPNRNTSLVQGRVPDSCLGNLTPHPGAISKRWPPPRSERCRGRVRLPNTQASHVKPRVVCLAGSSPTPLTADSAGRSAVAFQRMSQAGAMSVQPRVSTTTLGSFANFLATSVSPSLTRAMLASVAWRASESLSRSAIASEKIECSACSPPPRAS